MHCLFPETTASPWESDSAAAAVGLAPLGRSCLGRPRRCRGPLASGGALLVLALRELDAAGRSGCLDLTSTALGSLFAALERLDFFLRGGELLRS